MKVRLIAEEPGMTINELCEREIIGKESCAGKFFMYHSEVNGFVFTNGKGGANGWFSNKKDLIEGQTVGDLHVFNTWKELWEWMAE